MWVEDSSNLPSRSPPRFDRVPDQSQRSLWGGRSNSHSLLCGTASPLDEGDADDRRRAPALRRSSCLRRDLLIEDMMDLLGRAMIYALALLGLLHVLGLAAVA